MFALSAAARRSTMMAVSGRFAVATRPFSAQAYAKVEEVENMLKNKHWTLAKDNVHEIRDLMNETKTNHSLAKPDNAFEDQVEDTLSAIQALIEHPSTDNETMMMNDIQERVFGLKRMVKTKLYSA